MPIEFYNVKKRAKVQIDEKDIKKKIYERQLKDGSTQTRYAFRATDDETNLTKFCSKETWDNVSAPEEK